MFKASILSLVVLPLTATCVLAQANTMTSGRPSAALNPEQCEAIWNNAVPSGDLLVQAAAAPFIVNFTQVDKDGSGDVSKAKFEGACAKSASDPKRTEKLNVAFQAAFRAALSDSARIETTPQRICRPGKRALAFRHVPADDIAGAVNNLGRATDFHDGPTFVSGLPGRRIGHADLRARSVFREIRR